MELKGNSVLVYDGFHKIEEFMANMKGVPKKRERVLLKSAVAAVITDINQRIALVYQYRPCTGEKLYELPAGLIDKEGLSSEEILIEELREECGIENNMIQSISSTPIHHYYMVCGSSDATMSLYRVRLNTSGISKEVPDADVEMVEWFSIDQLGELIEKGTVKDAKTIMSYYILLNENK